MMLMKDVEALKQRNAPLDMTADGFRAAGHELVEQIAGWLETLRDAPVMRDEPPAEVRRLIGADRGLPESGADAGTLLHDAAALLLQHSLFNAHPRFFGYITSSPAPIGMFGDFLAAAVNANCGGWAIAPAAVCSSDVPTRNALPVVMTRDVMPGPSWRGSRWKRSPSSMS